VLEVPDVQHRQRQLDVSEVSGAVRKLAPAGGALAALVSSSLQKESALSGRLHVQNVHSLRSPVMPCKKELRSPRMAHKPMPAGASGLAS
jgi:hypothetical protein